MKKLSDDRLYELKAAANKQGKKSYEVMTNEELAAYRINCLDALNHRKRMMAKYEGKNEIMYKIAAEGSEWIEEALAYIDNKLSEKEEIVNTLDQFLNSWKEAARVYYTDLKEEMDQVQNTDYELTADNLRIIKKDAYSKRFQTQKYSEEKIQKLLNSELPSHVVRNLKIEISRYKFIEWAEGKTQSEVNFIRLIDTPEDLETALNGMVAEKKSMFLSRIENKAGKIIDMSGLGFGVDGSINGKVIGQEKTVNVKTTFAGGHTVQCLHYRVLVK